MCTGRMARVRSVMRLSIEAGSMVSVARSEEHTSELQSQSNLVCRLLLEKKNTAHRRGGLWDAAAPHARHSQPGAAARQFLTRIHDVAPPARFDSYLQALPAVEQSAPQEL